MKKIIFIFTLLFQVIPITIKSQNYFPLEVGNRWDYDYSYDCHGGVYGGGKFSIEIINQILLKSNEYYELSIDRLFGLKYLRIKNDSLYTFSNHDSTDCLVFVFNNESFNTYSSCYFESVQYHELRNLTYFNVIDTQQVHFAVIKGFEISKNFGVVNFGESLGLCYYDYNLQGCIISGRTYGTLLGIEESLGLISDYKLHQNYPNPFNPTTTINYHIPDQAEVRIKIYDIYGRLVCNLLDEVKNSGGYSNVWDGKNDFGQSVSSGTYFYQIIVDDFIQAKKMILLK